VLVEWLKVKTMNSSPSTEKKKKKESTWIEDVAWWQNPCIARARHWVGSTIPFLPLQKSIYCASKYTDFIAST
jgi:hypothetical protein